MAAENPSTEELLGIGKLIEEIGEAIEASPGDFDSLSQMRGFFDIKFDKDAREKAILAYADEIADLKAAILYFRETNGIPRQSRKPAPDSQYTGDFPGIHRRSDVRRFMTAAGRVLQLCGKAIACSPSRAHFDGLGPVKDRLAEPLSDLLHATQEEIDHRFADLKKPELVERIEDRCDTKLEKFRKWGLSGIHDGEKVAALSRKAAMADEVSNRAAEEKPSNSPRI